MRSGSKMNVFFLVNVREREWFYKNSNFCVIDIILWWCNMMYIIDMEFGVRKIRNNWKLWFCLFFVCFEEISFWVRMKIHLEANKKTEGCCKFLFRIKQISVTNLLKRILSNDLKIRYIWSIKLQLETDNHWKIGSIKCKNILINTVNCVPTCTCVR